MKSLIASDLITSITRSGAIPTGQSTFSTTDLLAMADECLADELVPMMMTLQEEFFVFSVDIPIVTTQFTYLMPYRAIGSKALRISYIPLTDTTNEYEMTRVEESRTVINNYGSQLFSSATPRYYYLRGNEIVLASNSIQNLQGGYIRIVYYIQPSNIVDVSRCAKITAVSTDNSTFATFTVSSIPTAYWGTTTTFDIIQGTSPHRNILIDQVCSVNTSTNQVSLTVPANYTANKIIAAGDYITLTQETPYPQLPSDIHNVLAELVVEKALKSLGMMPEVAMQRERINRMLVSVSNVLDNRVTDSVRKVDVSKSLIRAASTRYIRRI